MTRLIDADEIVYEETLRCAGRTGNSSTYYHDYHVWHGDIDKMPTVDAVPVEFIRHWIHALNHGRRNGKVWAAMVLQALLDAWAREERREG